MVGVLGGGLAHIRLADGSHLVLDGLSTAPGKARPDMYETLSDEVGKARDTRDARSGAPLASGIIRLAISPWGQVEVDGTPVGTAPPLNEITLSEGRHQITIRNEDFPPYSASINVTPGTPVTLKYKFGS